MDFDFPQGDILGETGGEGMLVKKDQKGSLCVCVRVCARKRACISFPLRSLYRQRLDPWLLLMSFYFWNQLIEEFSGLVRAQELIVGLSHGVGRMINNLVSHRRIYFDCIDVERGPREILQLDVDEDVLLESADLDVFNGDRIVDGKFEDFPEGFLLRGHEASVSVRRRRVISDSANQHVGPCFAQRLLDDIIVVGARIKNGNGAQIENV